MTQKLATTLQNNTKCTAVSGLRGSSSAWLAGLAAEEGNCCCIVPDEHLVSIFKQDLGLFTDKHILGYPGHEIPPYTLLSPDQHITAARLSTLYQLKERDTGYIMVTSIEALLRRVMPSKVLTRVSEYLMAGEDCDQDSLLKDLVSLGYEKVALTQSVGEFSVRGGIIDIFPPPFLLEEREVHEGPLRLDFFGDTVESLRSYDPFTQRSTGELADATLLPVTDILIDHECMGTRNEIAQTFQVWGDNSGWDEDETARIIERIKSGQRFAGMEFFLPLFYNGLEQTSSVVLDFLSTETTLILIDPESVLFVDYKQAQVIKLHVF